mgnify:CR=1 FL=1
MKTFKQFIQEEDRKIYAKKFGELPEFTPALAEKDYQVGEVKFSAEHGLGAVPFNQSPYYHGLVALVKPSKFLELAHEEETDPKRVFEIVKLIWDGYAMGIPFLDVLIDDNPEWMMPQIKGHEGRNRMKAFMEVEGDRPVPIHLFLRGGMRNRHVTDEMIKQLEDSVVSQRGHTVTHPFIKVYKAP